MAGREEKRREDRRGASPSSLSSRLRLVDGAPGWAPASLEGSGGHIGLGGSGPTRPWLLLLAAILSAVDLISAFPMIDVDKHPS